MRGGRGKRIALASGLLGCGVLAVSGIAARDRILEEYYLFKLDHPRGARIDHEEDDGLISRLGQLRSVRAVPRILKHLEVNSRDGGPQDPCIKLCIEALASAGRPAIPQLVLALESEDPFFPAAVSMLALGRIHEAARESIPALQRKLRSPNPDFRIGAAIVLGLIGPPEVALQLREVMAGDEHSEVRAAAALGLLQTGSPGEDALLQMLKSTAKSRERTIEALESIDQRTPLVEECFGLRVRELPPALVLALDEAKVAQGKP